MARVGEHVSHPRLKAARARTPRFNKAKQKKTEEARELTASLLRDTLAFSLMLNMTSLSATLLASFVDSA